MPGELARLLLQEERAIQLHEEPVERINLGTEQDKKEVKIGANLEPNIKQRLIQMLRDYVEIFAWSYEDMPGLDTDIVVHRLPIKGDYPPVKQKVCRMMPDMFEKIKAEVMKQFDVGFLVVTSRGVRGSVWIGFKAKTHLIQRLIHLRFSSVLDDIFKKIQSDPIQFYAV